MIYLVRHGETPWSVTGQHTGLTDLHLTENGRTQALALKPLLQPLSFSEVWCSPLIRARETCQLAGFGARSEIMNELAEWDYGDYEGLTSAEIHEKKSNWNIFDHGAKGGESIAQVQARANRVTERARQAKGHVLLFSSGHILRMIALSWIGQPASLGKHFNLDTATISILAHEKEAPSIKVWNLSASNRFPT